VTRHSESLRQIVHISMGAFALLLRDLTTWQAAGMALIALLLNLFALPRIAGRMFRPGEIGRARPGGIVLYPLAVLVLVVTFPRRPDIVAAAWAILAAGDGLAAVVGRRIGGPRWPWNPRKSLAGSAAFFTGGGLAGMALSAWTRPAALPVPPIELALAAPVAAAFVAALVESLPIGLDDNLTVPFTAGAVLWAASLIDPVLLAAAGPVAAARLPAALAVNAAAALAGYRARTVARSGVAAGLVIGVTIYVCAGGAGWLLLFAGFAVASLTSRVGLERKAVLGLAEAREGRRGAGNALANCGLAAAAAAVALVSEHRDTALLAMVAALVAGASDTAASELGQAWGRRAFLPTSFARVAPGTPGAVSLEGTTAGVAAAAVLAGVAVLLGLIPIPTVWIVVTAATVGAFVESVLAVSFERSGVLDNDVLNFLNTGVAATVALALLRSMS
jgi:uncharacterized protein (TIGR00297 family)